MYLLFGVACLHAQKFEQLGRGFVPRTFYHQLNINYYINCTDNQGLVYSVHYDTVSSSFNYGQEYSQIRLRVYNGISWLHTPPIRLYNRYTIDAPRVMDIKFWGGKIYLSGSFDSSEHNLGAGVLIYDNGWQGTGLKLMQKFPDYFEVNALHTFKDGILITGNFDSVPGIRVNGMMMFQQGVWSPVGLSGEHGFRGLSGTSNVFFNGLDSLYVFNKNKIKPDSIEIGQMNFKKLGVWRNGLFEPLPYPKAYIAAVTEHQNQLVVIPSSYLVYVSSITIRQGTQWVDFSLPDNDSFYATNYMGAFSQNNNLYLFFQSPGNGVIIYVFDGTKIEKYNQFKLAETYINIEFRADKEAVYLAGNFNWIQQDSYLDSFRRIVKIEFKPQSLLTGICYLDANGDKQRQAGELVLGGVRVFDETQKRMTLTDGKGHFTMSYPLSSDWLISANNKQGITSTQTYSTVNSADSVYYVEIPMQSNGSDDIGVYVYCQTGQKAKQGFNTSYVIELSNQSPVSQTVQLKFYNDRRVSSKQFDGFVPDLIQSDYWIKTIEVKANASMHYRFNCVYSVDSFVLDEKVTVKAEINTSDNNDKNNKDEINQIVVAAFDPNIKVADPSAIISNNEVIKYIIHFENLGNSEAVNVTVVDTIGSLIDIYSIVWGGTSHDNKLKFRVENNCLIWSFEGINLPARKQDSIKCHGYVTLRINLEKDAKAGDTIFNKAAIFFDYQKPVITNKAQVVFDRNRQLSHLSDTKGILMYPNPGNGIIFYENNSGINSWRLIDSQGKSILNIYLDEVGFVDFGDDLAPGVYFLQSEIGSICYKLVIH